ncbi:hypothetical protein [Halobacillus alkaliphilus]|nr:hypothetical protein [Halobacillus alkaliphilus]
MMVYRRDGFGGSRFYPEDGEIEILCTFVETGHRYVILQYLELPFSYRLIKRHGVHLLDDKAHLSLIPYLNAIDQGVYDNPILAHDIHKLMS